MKYRPDIDGLRALAVIAVVLYHVGFGIPGGFAGVDVFFVISGYLITSIIIKELDNNDFSISNFYEKRARRLFPALFFMLIATTIVASFLFIPEDLVEYSKSAVASLFFVSNFFFYLDVGYFNESSDLKPLLHTWSLGVEEQFYLVVPLALAVVYKFFGSKLRVFFISIAVIISFFIGLWFAGHSIGFYLPFSRAWELGIGMLLALWGLHLRNIVLANLLGILGVILLVSTFFIFSESTPWPGFAALAPVFGAGAIIVSGSYPYSLVSRFLSFKKVVGLGRISYSLYLWHWPVIVFAGYGRFESFSVYEQVALVVVSLVLAFLSYKFVEEPFRKRRFFSSRSSVVFGSMTFMFSTFLIAAIFVLFDGFPNRVPNEITSRWDQTDNTVTIYGNCHGVSYTKMENEEFCIHGDGDLVPSFILVGDSHARSIAPAVFEASANLGVSGWQFTGPGFVPTPGRERIGSVTGEGILDNRVKVFEEFLNQHSDVKKVIVTGYWYRYATGLSYREQRASWKDSECDYFIEKDCVATSLHRSLVRLGKKFKDRDFIFLDDVPVGWKLHPKSHYRAEFSNSMYNRLYSSQFPGVDIDTALSQYNSYTSILKGVSDELPNFSYYPVVFKSICNDQGCSALDENGKLKFNDGDHLSAHGARLLSDDIEDVLARYVLD